jgi:hypothetical protein
LHPFETKAPDSDGIPSSWVEGSWKVFLNSSPAIERAVDYVEMNPVKDGKPKQRWSFVKPFHE